MDNNGVEHSSAPTLCNNGCGFYANGLHGLCSKCFREKDAEAAKQRSAAAQVAEAMSAQAPSPAQPAPSPVPTPSAVPEAEPVASTSLEAVAASPAAPKPSTTRCLVCNKKVGLTGFSCKCNGDAVFCSAHRYAEAHNCSFDYKTAQRQQLAEKNPLIQAAKLTKF